MRRKGQFPLTLRLLEIFSARKQYVFLTNTGAVPGLVDLFKRSPLFFKALEQDIASRQSSISAMKVKVKKFVETADPSAAALVHSKMDTLCQRFSDACDNHRQKVAKLEQLKEKVEQFEELADKVQQFVAKSSQDLHETDGPGKSFAELSQLMQVDVNINDDVPVFDRCSFAPYYLQVH